jgi:hypothetical protein
VGRHSRKEQRLKLEYWPFVGVAAFPSRDFPDHRWRLHRRLLQFPESHVEADAPRSDQLLSTHFEVKICHLLPAALMLPTKKMTEEQYFAIWHWMQKWILIVVLVLFDKL